MASGDRVQLKDSERPPIPRVKVSQPEDRVIEISIIVRPKRKLPSITEFETGKTTGLDPADFYATRRDIADVKAFVESLGLTVDEASENLRVVRASGVLPDVAKAFEVNLGVYSRGTDDFLYYTDPISIPNELDGVIEWVFGLDTSGVVRMASFLTEAGSDEENQAAAGMREQPSEDVILSYSVPELGKLYSFPRGDGNGRCVGIIALSGGFTRSDLSCYFQSLELDVPNITLWKCNRSGGEIADYGVTQGIEVIGAIVPKATIALYNCNSTSLSVKDLFDTFNYAINESKNDPEVLVNPWVIAENYSPRVLPGYGIQRREIEEFEKLFVTAYIRKITVCSASGSIGGMQPIATVPSRAEPGTVLSGVGLPDTSYPSSSPLNTSVGGTTLYASSGKHRREEVWNRLRVALMLGGHLMNVGATGGGVSQILGKPEFQNRANVPPAEIYSWTNGHFLLISKVNGRGIPDVAVDGDVFTGYQIYFEGKWGVAGGTGISVVLWGTLVVLLNEYVKRRLGWINRALYELQFSQRDVFTTIVGGNNGAYNAPAGQLWNPCCGLGVPHGKRLAEALKKLPP